MAENEKVDPTLADEPMASTRHWYDDLMANIVSDPECPPDTVYLTMSRHDEPRPLTAAHLQAMIDRCEAGEVSRFECNDLIVSPDRRIARFTIVD